MFGSEWAQDPSRKGKLFVFDVIEQNSKELKRLPYHERYNRLHQMALEGRFPPNWHLIANFDTAYVDQLWQRFVASKLYEGLVFRDPNALWDTELLRAKDELTIDLRVTGFAEGSGRLEGTLGALLATDREGNQHTVGGGLTDRLRREIWSNKDSFLGSVFVCIAKKQFKSGQLRHPNFKEWHADKK